MATPFEITARALDADRGRFHLLVWGIAVALAGAWLAWMTLSRVTLYEVSSKARFEVKGAALPVAASQAGLVKHVAMTLGRDVRAGEVLVVLDDRVALAREAEVAKQLAAMPARQQALRSELSVLQVSLEHERQAASADRNAALARVAEASAQLDFAREQERRLESATAQAAVADIDLGRARSERRRLFARLEQVQSEAVHQASQAHARDAQARARQEALLGQIAALEGERLQATATLERARSERDRLTIRAPLAGRLADVPPLGPGAWLGEGHRVATVVPEGKLRVVASFEPSRAMGRLRPGQVARIRLDGFAWTEHGMIDAQVDRVASEVRDGTLSVEFSLVPGSKLRGADLQHGLTGTVEVAIESVAPVVLLLRSMGQATRTPGAVPAQAQSGG